MLPTFQALILCIFCIFVFAYILTLESAYGTVIQLQSYRTAVFAE